MKAHYRQILPVLLALVLIVSAALSSSACTLLTGPESSESRVEISSESVAETALPSKAEESSTPAAEGTTKSETASETKDIISELMVDGRRLGDMSQEEKEAHPTVPAEFLVNGERVEVMPPEGIRNLAEQEMFLRNMQKRVQTLRYDDSNSEDTGKESKKPAETSSIPVVPKGDHAEHPEFPLDQFGVLVLRDGASQKIAFLDAAAVSRLNGLLDSALSGQAVKPVRTEANSRILFPGSGQLSFDSRDFFSAERAQQDFILQRGEESYNLAKDSPLRADFRAFLEDVLKDPKAIFADTSVSELPRQPLARAAFSVLPEASSARLAIANASEQNLNVSSSYFLYRYDGKKCLPLDLAAAPSWSLSRPAPIAPGSTEELDVPLEKDYGKLERGLYCLRFSLTSDDLSKVENLILYFVLP